ncbi:MAG: glycosyltransferase family 4 protein [bacterium]|nr:glycosyltransferase family 4 protein [bacterium]
MKNAKTEKHIAVIGIKGYPPRAGVDFVADEIIQSALKNGFKVTVYGKRSCQNRDYKEENLKIVSIRDIKGKHLSAFSYGVFSALHALLFGRYDLIHLHCADYGYIVPLLRLRFRVLSTSHGAEYKRDKWNFLAKAFFRVVERPFIKYSDICTCVSRKLSEYYREKYRKKVLFIPNRIDFESIDRIKPLLNGARCAAYGLEPGKYILFCAGRIIPSKGCDILLKAGERAHIAEPIAVIGNIKDRYYKKYLSKLKKENTVFINAIDDRKTLFDIIRNCRFFVFPSTYEAMSMMLLEAAALGKGIVCSDIPENVEAIGENALFFKSGFIDDLAEKLKYALEHPGIIDELGKRGYDWVRENRNWEKFALTYIDLYCELMSQGK